MLVRALITRYNQLNTMLKVLVLLSVTSFKLPFNAVTKKWIPESHYFSLWLPHLNPIKKKGNPTLAHYWNSHFPDPASVFSTHPEYHNKKSPKPPSTKATVDPPYCGRQKEPATYSWSAALEILPNSVHILGMLVLYWLRCMVCGHKGPGIEFKVCLMSW